MQGVETSGWRTALAGSQMLFVAFGALVLMPLITGMDPSVALFTAGIGTLIFQFTTHRQIPVFLASSFAFIAPILYSNQTWGVPATLGGLFAAGIVYVLLSLAVRLRGPGKTGRRIGFFAAVVWHARVLARRHAVEVRAGVHERYLKRIRGEDLKGPDGRAHIPADHPYASDIDLVGVGSLFQRIDVTHTVHGERTLAEAQVPFEVPRGTQPVLSFAYDAESIEDAASVAGPHSGAAWFSNLCLWGQCKTMQPGHPDITWLNLAGDARSIGGTEWTLYGSTADWVVPWESAMHMVDVPAERRHVYNDVPHNGSDNFMNDDRVLGDVSEALAKPGV